MNHCLIAFLLVTPIAASAAIDRDVSSPIMLTPDGRNELSILVGGFQPTSRFGFRGQSGDQGERFGTTGNAFLVDYIRNVNESIGVGLEYAYIHRGEYTANNSFLTSGYTTRVRGDSNLLMALARVQTPGRGWRPYALGGVGVHHTRLDLHDSGDLSYTPFSVRDESGLVKGTASGLALMGRAGLQYVYGGGSFMGLEGGYYYLESKSYPVTAYGSSNGFQNVKTGGSGLIFAVKLGIRFGADPDRG